MPIKEITRYVTSDGWEFIEYEEAKIHENSISFHNWLYTPKSLPSVIDLLNNCDPTCVAENFVGNERDMLISVLRGYYTDLIKGNL